MSNRILAAGVVAASVVAAGTLVLGISSKAAPLATPGASPGRSGPSLPLVNPGHPLPPMPGFGTGGIHPRFRAFRASHLYNEIPPGSPLWWGYAGAGPGYYPPDYALPYESNVFVYPPYGNFPSYSEPLRPQVV